MKDAKIIAMTAIAPVIWGTTFLVTTQFLPPDRPFTAAVMRVLPAGILLALWGRRFPAGRNLLKLLTVSALNIGVFQALLFISAYRLPGGQAAVAAAIQPVLVMILARVFDDQKPSAGKLVAAGGIIIGMSVLFLSPDAVWDPVGVTAALMSAASLATGTWLSRKWDLDMPVTALTGWQLMTGGIMLLPLAILHDSPLPPLGLSEAAAYVYLFTFNAMLSYVLWFAGVKRLPAVAVTSLGLLSPVTAVLLGWAVLNQNPGLSGMAGLITVLFSILLMQKFSAEQPARDVHIRTVV
ncbi:EamA family transporter [uncultured Leclercia sp.]|uniref:EamA family transporter n=1 Tax=uncultured Leclercia sp. TaxID=332959 RepID=UPI002593FB42|nr:EamA family transporter [uncultured Leclercia sp.]